MSIVPKGLEPGAGLAEVIRENLGDQGVRVFDLPTLTVPSGKSSRFSGLDDPTDIECVVVGWKRGRAYWAQGFGKGNRVPQCSSADGLEGLGTPGGSCVSCEYSAFGSEVTDMGERTSGQACKEFRQLLLLLEGRILPVVLRLPPTSIKSFTGYVLDLTTQQRGYWQVVTKVSLEKSVSGGGVEYQSVAFTKMSDLKPTDVAQMDTLRNVLQIEWTPPTSLPEIGGGQAGDDF